MILTSDEFFPGQEGEIFCPIPEGKRVTRVDLDPPTAARFTLLEDPRPVAREDMRALGHDSPGLRLRVRFEGQIPARFVAQISTDIDLAPLQRAVERAHEDAWRRGGDDAATIARAERDLAAAELQAIPRLALGGGSRGRPN